MTAKLEYRFSKKFSDEQDAGKFVHRLEKILAQGKIKKTASQAENFISIELSEKEKKTTIYTQYGNNYEPLECFLEKQKFLSEMVVSQKTETSHGR